jgi:glycine/D-amino acid oxidase-like deaminating enzyme
MSQRILVIGAGVIGASIAYHLSLRGAQVTVLDQSLPATGASGSSFGWINANFVETPEYFRLRRAAIDAYRDLGDAMDLNDCVRWTGCLWWEDEGAALDAHFATLEIYGYEAEKVDAARFAELEPALAEPPLAAVLSRIEGAADGARLTRKLLEEAAKQGAQILPGCAVTRLAISGGRVIGGRDLDRQDHRRSRCNRSGHWHVGAAVRGGCHPASRAQNRSHIANPANGQSAEPHDHVARRSCPSTGRWQPAGR